MTVLVLVNKFKGPDADGDAGFYFQAALPSALLEKEGAAVVLVMATTTVLDRHGACIQVDANWMELDDDDDEEKTPHSPLWPIEIACSAKEYGDWQPLTVRTDVSICPMDTVELGEAAVPLALDKPEVLCTRMAINDSTTVVGAHLRKYKHPDYDNLDVAGAYMVIHNNSEIDIPRCVIRLRMIDREGNPIGASGTAFPITPMSYAAAKVQWTKETSLMDGARVRITVSVPAAGRWRQLSGQYPA